MKSLAHVNYLFHPNDTVCRKWIMRSVKFEVGNFLSSENQKFLPENTIFLDVNKIVIKLINRCRITIQRKYNDLHQWIQTILFY